MNAELRWSKGKGIEGSLVAGVGLDGGATLILIPSKHCSSRALIRFEPSTAVYADDQKERTNDALTRNSLDILKHWFNL